MRGVVIVKFDFETVKIFCVLGVNSLDKFFRRDAFVPCPDHYRGSVCVIGAEIKTLIAVEFLKPYPYICLEIFDHVADMDRAICIRQC